MAVRYRIDTEKRIARITVDGQPGPEEHDRIRREMVADPDYVPGMPILLDNRGRKEPSDKERVQEFAMETRSSPVAIERARVAIVVASTAEFGMARMYALLTEQSPQETRVFRDMDEAEAWLLEPRDASGESG